MMYWSTQKIDAIVAGTTGNDAVERIGSKKFSNVTSYAVSATSYALLCNFAVKASERSQELIKPVQHFLQEQHMEVGGFASTQVCCAPLTQFLVVEAMFTFLHFYIYRLNVPTMLYF